MHFLTKLLSASALGRSARTKALLIPCKLIFPAFPGRILVGSKLQAPGNSVSPAERTEQYPRRWRMKVLVVGATGFVGSQVAQALSARGHQTRVLVRGGRAHPRGSQFEGRVEVVDGDLRRPETLASARTGIEAVVCTATSMPQCHENWFAARRSRRSGVTCPGGGKSGRQKVRLHLLLRKHSLRFATRDRQAIL